MNAFAQYFHKNNKSINLLVNDQQIFEKCSKIWDEIKSLFRKKFDPKPVYNDNYIKPKINLCNTNFYVTKIPIEGEYCSILLLMQIKKYLQIFFKKIKYAIKKKKIMYTIKRRIIIRRI